MNIYAVSDPHGFYDPLIAALTQKGWFQDTQPKKLVVCGDLLDRGHQANQLVKFMLDIAERDELIYIKGNHQDLLIHFCEDFLRNPYSIAFSHHASNGTLNTAIQLSGFDSFKLIDQKSAKAFIDALHKSDYMTKLYPLCQDYWETQNYVFIHGWLPDAHTQLQAYPNNYTAIKNWREANAEQWEVSRWVNGMYASRDLGYNIQKTVVCGHWHCSFGHAIYSNLCSEFGTDAIWEPYTAPGIIAIDSCTAHTGKVNCLKITEEKLLNQLK